MGRLTWRDTIGQALLAAEYNDKYDALELIDILLDRLAAYEDTGLEPEAIKSLLAEFQVNLAALDSYRKAKKVKTNADKIRKMTDEELAEYLSERSTAPSCTSRCHKDYEVYGEQRTFCHDCWLDWLKQEVESDG